MKTKRMTREHYRDRYAAMRDVKRELEEAKRWEKFLIDRAQFDEELARTMDVFEVMMLNIGERA